jgi:hypothetical protein
MLGETANLKLPNAVRSGFLPPSAEEDVNCCRVVNVGPSEMHTTGVPV